MYNMLDDLPVDVSENKEVDQREEISVSPESDVVSQDVVVVGV